VLGDAARMRKVIGGDLRDFHGRPLRGECDRLVGNAGPARRFTGKE
jgi:hypothetical protein